MRTAPLLNSNRAVPPEGTGATLLRPEMNSVIILGSGRSGTSMVAGMFRHTGAMFGNEPIGATIANPYGYYEDRQINDLNNRLIERMLEWPFLNRRVRPLVSPRVHFDVRGYWLAAPRVVRTIELYPGEIKQMRRVTSAPFCYKDPRFNITLDAWRPHLPSETRFIVVFRQPEKTIKSVLRDAAEMYHPPLAVNRKWIETCWFRHYRHILRHLSQQGEWLFMHYDQVISGAALTALEAFVETPLDASQLDSAASRTSDVEKSGPLSRYVMATYEELCDRATRDVAALSAERI